MVSAGALLVAALVVAAPRRGGSGGGGGGPPVPCGIACLPNGGMGLPAAADPDKPLGWGNYSWTNSTFGWEVPPCGGAAGGATTNALRVTGGMGSWGAPVNLSSAPADVRQAGGDLLLRVRIAFLAKHVRSGSQLVIYISGARVSSAGGIAGWTTHELQRQGDACSPGTQFLSIGDIRLPAALSPAAQPSRLVLNLRMNDGPMAAADEPPTSVWFTSAEVLFVPSQAPAGMAQSVGQVGEQIDVWAEHASHKVFPAATPPLPPNTRLGSAGPVAVTLPPMMRGGSTALQLALRVKPGAAAAACALSWPAADGLKAGLVLAVNISRPSGTYGVAGLHPDPIVPLAAGATFRVLPGHAQPVLLTLRASEASLAVSCDGSGPLAMQLQAKIWDLSLPAVPTTLTHSNIWIEPVEKLMSSMLGPQADGKLWTEWELSKGFLKRLFASRATDFMQPCTDALSTDAPINTTCFEAALDFAHAHSPWGKQQFVSVPGTWLGGSFGDAISWQGISIFDTRGDELQLTPKFVMAFTHVAGAFLRVLVARGVPAEQREVKLVDEPALQNATILRKCILLFNLTRKVCAAHGGCCIRNSGTYLPPALFPSLSETDIWDVHADGLTASPHMWKAAQDATGIRLSVYNNAVDSIDQPSLRTRAFFWEVGLGRVVPLIGSLSWWADSDWSAVSPWDDANANTNGDGILFYPPWGGPLNLSANLGQPFVPMSSMRWEQATAGLLDHELFMLARAVNRTAADAVVSTVTWGMPRVSPASDQPFTVDCAVLESARSQLAAIAESSAMHVKTDDDVTPAREIKNQSSDFVV